MDKMILQYLRDRKNRKRGVIVAVSKGNNFSVGWSIANTKAGDKFDSKIGEQRAVGRAEKALSVAEKNAKFSSRGEVVELSIADSVLDQVEFFSDRAAKYFKDKKKVFKLIRKSENISEIEANKLKNVFVEPATPDSKDDFNFESNVRPSFKNSNTFVTPRGTFVSIGNETLLIHRTDGKWKVEKVS